VAAPERRHCQHANSSLSSSSHRPFGLRRLAVPTRRHRAGGARYLRFGLSYGDVEELLVERGAEVDHVSIYRWVLRFTPLLAEAARLCRHRVGYRWQVLYRSGRSALLNSPAVPSASTRAKRRWMADWDTLATGSARSADHEYGQVTWRDRMIGSYRFGSPGLPRPRQAPVSGA
jgi:hypothetical protein